MRSGSNFTEKAARPTDQTLSLTPIKTLKMRNRLKSLIASDEIGAFKVALGLVSVTMQLLHLESASVQEKQSVSVLRQLASGSFSRRSKKLLHILVPVDDSFIRNSSIIPSFK